MTLPFKNITLWGVGGDNIGKHILQSLVADGRFNLTILARESSTSTYGSHPASSYTIVRVPDSMPHASLVSALHDTDALVSAVGPAGNAGQEALALAAAEAGVRRFIPSEWGMDNGDPANAALSPFVFGVKTTMAGKLDAIARANPHFAWTAVANGIWLDWALDVDFVDVDARGHTVGYWDGGNHRATCTTMPYVGRATVEILKRPELFRNQRVFLEAFAASQRELVAELERVQGARYQVVKEVDGKKRVAELKEVLDRGYDEAAGYEAVTAGVWMAEYKNDFVNSGKEPMVERFVDLPKVTLQDVVREFVDTH